MIDKYINMSSSIDTSVRGGNKKCYVFDDVVLLKGSFVNKGEEKKIRKEKLDILKNNGVNVCRVLDNKIVDNIEYELQERAKGEELYNFSLSNTLGGQKRFLEVLNSLSNQDISFYIKFLNDWQKILQMGFDIDPSKCSNFFYDGKNISFIDLNLSNNYERAISWMYIHAAVVLRGGGLLWQCKSVYEEANEKIKLIYQKIGIVALTLGVNLDNYVSYLDSNGEYGLEEYFTNYQNSSIRR